MKQRKHESGQAMMELTIMLLALTGMILAVVMISGIEISSNTMLLSARYNAQINSRSDSASSGQRNSEIGNWNYFKLDLTRNRSGKRAGTFGSSETLIQEKGRRYKIRSRSKSLLIPFSFQSTSSANSGVNSLYNSYDNMRSAEYSKYDDQNSVGDRYTQWKDMQLFDSNFQHDYSTSLHDGNAYNAAHLVGGMGSTSSGAATVNRRHQAEGVNSRDDAADAMYATFRDIFGVNISRIKMQEHISNRVYLPAQPVDTEQNSVPEEPEEEFESEEESF